MFESKYHHEGWKARNNSPPREVRHGSGGPSFAFEKKAYTDEVKTELFGAVDRAREKMQAQVVGMVEKYDNAVRN